MKSHVKLWFSYGFSYGFPMVFPMVFSYGSYGFSYGSYGFFKRFFLWVFLGSYGSYGFSYDFPMVFPWFTRRDHALFGHRHQPPPGRNNRPQFHSQHAASRQRSEHFWGHGWPPGDFQLMFSLIFSGLFYGDFQLILSWFSAKS